MVLQHENMAYKLQNQSLRCVLQNYSFCTVIKIHEKYWFKNPVFTKCNFNENVILYTCFARIYLTDGKKSYKERNFTSTLEHLLIRESVMISPNALEVRLHKEISTETKL